MRYVPFDSRRVVRGIALALFIVLQPTHATTGDAAVEAIWRVQTLPFEFRAADDFSYSCEIFQKKLRGILMAVGAHPTVIIQPECSRRAMINRASARITLASPAPANDENVREATSVDSRRELIARVQNTALPTAADLQRFRAVWQPLSLGERGDLRLTENDCELLRQLKEQVFPKLDVEVTHSRLHCSPVGKTRPVVKVLALMPALA
jgi:hypothetical protein